ncbi:protein-glutamate O-methyltransferase CheR [Arcticibacter tournemirensis]|uniref:Protein-glutamate O-methyltransferase CheR n=1 Tax=Arcticibacter tournemirensis TaxID=699437 RepID=A0A5M9HE10_9SPHI|nr:protein-glutamate O-methyltransferase CheR [Arcticibacter tournemirensis]KAA8483841.1 protein-glutamate O-methyltransferase CheR [Arcticibacter tournemirensis]
MHNEKLTSEELEELINWINNIHGFSFDGYSRASLKRRVARLLELRNFSFYDLKGLLINDLDFFEEFIIDVTVNVTEMFRDPLFFGALKQNVFPYLASFQEIKIWSAGCSTGEEVYSLGVLLERDGLYKRTFLYGTDINPKAIETARRGIYSLSNMKQYSENYNRIGIAGSLSDFYLAQYDAALIAGQLKKNTLFSVHNLVSDGVFNEFQMICCRNVLIYFNAELQQRVLQLFYDSLCPLGFLCLGAKEILRGTELSKRFRIIDKFQNIYQKIS